jgi:hypothetical protein
MGQTDVAFRATESYRSWLRFFAKSQRLDVSRLIDRALAALALQEKFGPPPSRLEEPVEQPTPRVPLGDPQEFDECYRAY